MSVLVTDSWQLVDGTMIIAINAVRTIVPFLMLTGIGECTAENIVFTNMLSSDYTTNFTIITA